MHPFEDLIDPEARRINGAIDDLLDEAYPATFEKLGIDPYRHGFTFKAALDTLRVSSNQHPLWKSIRYDRGHSRFGARDLTQQLPHLRMVAQLDRLQDVLSAAGLPEELPPCMLHVPTILRSELERRGIAGRDLLDIPHDGTSIPQLVWIGAETDPRSTAVTKMAQKSVGAFPDSGPSLLLRRYIDRIDIVMMELAPGIVVEEEVGGHQIRMAGQPLPETAISSIGALVGKHISEVIAHPSLVEPDLRIRYAKVHKKLTRIVVHSGMTRLEDVPSDIAAILADLNGAMAWKA